MYIDTLMHDRTFRTFIIITIIVLFEHGSFFGLSDSQSVCPSH
jgi:hypothetical protein